MQDKIIAAIAAYLEKETYFSETLIKDQKTRQFMRINVLQSHEDFCQEIATEIAAAIAPLVEAGEVDDSQYTDDFLKWREKYFDRKTQVKHFRSKHNGEFRDAKQLERQYERAYNCNSKKSK